MGRTGALNLNRLDLNLLRVFDSVYAEMSLMRASRHLNLSHSAISHALGRLRDAVGDELFIRTGRGIVPTERAREMAPPIRDALRSIEETLGPEIFDPGSATNRFRIGANDGITALLLSQLSRNLLVSAPEVSLQIKPCTRLDLAEQLDVGGIDVALGIFSSVPERFASRAIWSSQYVLLTRRDHPFAQGPIDIGDLARFPVVIVSVGGEEDGAISGFITERGLARQSEMFDRRALDIALTEQDRKVSTRIVIPHSLAIPSFLAGTDMYAILPRPTAEELARHYELDVVSLPYPSRPAVLEAVWRRDRTGNPALSWLIEQVAEITRTWDAGTTEPPAQAARASA